MCSEEGRIYNVYGLTQREPILTTDTESTREYDIMLEVEGSLWFSALSCTQVFKGVTGFGECVYIGVTVVLVLRSPVQYSSQTIINCRRGCGGEGTV